MGGTITRPEPFKTYLLDYIASPYSDPNKDIVASRVVQFKKAIGQLIGRGHSVVSPLLFHDVLPYSPNLGSDWKFWEGHGKLLLTRCHRLIVICLPGWTSSEGTMSEIEKAKNLNLPIGFVEMLDKEALGEIVWQTPKTSNFR